jgi:hypothetical protein
VLHKGAKRARTEGSGSNRLQLKDVDDDDEVCSIGSDRLPFFVHMKGNLSDPASLDGFRYVRGRVYRF